MAHLRTHASIKTHTQAIYRKLGVSTRREAVQQAERAGIL